MRSYCFRCPGCGVRFEDHDPDLVRSCPACGGGPVVRDYRAEGFSLGSGTRSFDTRAMSHEEVARLFLPTTDDFKGPDDPDGTKGLRKWREEHAPKSPRAFHPEERALRRSF